MVLVSVALLAVATILTLAVVLASVNDRINTILTRAALGLFGGYVTRVGHRREHRQATLRAAHVPTTYRVYASKTVLYAGMLAIAGSIFGVYLVWGLVVVLAIPQATVEAILPTYLEFLSNLFEVPKLAPMQLFVLVLTSSLTVGMNAGTITYWLRWWWPAHVAENRRRRIEASLPRTVAFIYALSRSGMAFPQVMRTLAENRGVYGDAADEVGVAVNDMDMFGRDMLTAIKSMARRTPSEQFEEFTENLASVLQSGRSLSEFLHHQYEYYQEETEAQQEQLLDRLATLAEVYVTLFVAGPLFLITILVIIGLTVGRTLVLLQAIGYFVLPLANLAFIIYLTTITESLRATRDRLDITEPIGGIANVRGRSREEEALPFSPDGGTPAARDPNLQRLDAYDRFRVIHRRIANPIRTVLHNPATMLWVVIPLGVLVTLARVPAAFEAGSADLTVLDDILVQGALFVVGSFAVVEELYKRRVRRIESVIPDFLDRLASTNEAGMTIIESLHRVQRSDLGALDPEMKRLWRDIEWGADVETALYRLERRVRTSTITRMVTLINKAMHASGDLAAVLRIAAEQTKADRRLKRARRQEMFTYLTVIYISFFVFMIIVVALNNFLIPSLPTETPGVEQAGTFAAMANFDQEAYSLVFFHTALIQGTFSGFVAGQMGGGDVRDGALHATILLAFAYVLFLVL